MSICSKCKTEYIEGITDFIDYDTPPETEKKASAPAIVSLISAEAPLAERIVEFLTYSGLDVHMDFDQEADLFSLTIPENQYLEGIKLMKVRLANDALQTLEEQEERAQRSYTAPVRVFVRASDRYSDLHSSAVAFLLVGTVTLAIVLLAAGGVIDPPLRGNTRFLSYLVMTGLGLIFMGIGLLSWQKSRKLKQQIDEENRFTESVYHWFLSTYTGPQIDLAADAQMDQDVALNPEKRFTIISDEIRCLKRMDVIREFLKREYQQLDDSYVEYLCEEVYQKIFES